MYFVLSKGDFQISAPFANCKEVQREAEAPPPPPPFKIQIGPISMKGIERRERNRGRKGERETHTEGVRRKREREREREKKSFKTKLTRAMPGISASVCIYIYISRIHVTCWLRQHSSFLSRNSQNCVVPRGRLGSQTLCPTASSLGTLALAVGQGTS